MRKDDLVDLLVDMTLVREAIEALQAHDAYWQTDGGVIRPNLPEEGRLRVTLTRLRRTIDRAKQLPKERERAKR